MEWREVTWNDTEWFESNMQSRECFFRWKSLSRRRGLQINMHFNGLFRFYFSSDEIDAKDRLKTAKYNEQLFFALEWEDMGGEIPRSDYACFQFYNLQPFPYTHCIYTFYHQIFDKNFFFNKNKTEKNKIELMLRRRTIYWV